jgi:2-oxoglutarate ferredoxin oxidoreductase subunit gamma
MGRTSIMAITEIRISGFGGQGIIKTGYIIGKSASIYDNKEATLTQSFGPEARGSACSAQVLISKDKILYPYVKKPHVLVALSQEAYTKFEPTLKEDGILLIDKDLVKTKPPRDKIKMYAIPATRFAEELGNKIVVNIVMLGFFTAITKVVNKEATKKAVESSVPPRTIPLNIKAFDRGYDYGIEILKKEKDGDN